MATWCDVAADIEFTMPIDVATFARLAPPPCRVLDHGCGYGRISALLVGQGYTDVHGYDVSAAMIARGVRADARLKLSWCAATRIPEDDRTFDAAVSCALLTSMVDERQRKDVVGELLRVLKPGGLLHVAEFLRSSNVRYSDQGTFNSGMGIPMKHFETTELLNLLSPFEQLSVQEVAVNSLSGSAARAMHYFGRRPVDLMFKTHGA